MAVYLTGQLIAGGGGFDAWTDFGASSGFIAGVNALQFLVTNHELFCSAPSPAANIGLDCIIFAAALPFLTGCVR